MRASFGARQVYDRAARLSLRASFGARQVYDRAARLSLRASRGARRDRFADAAALLPLSTRLLAVVAVAGQVNFVAAWVIGGLIQPGYSTADQTVSELFARTADHPVVLWIGLAGLVPSYLATATILLRAVGRRGRAAASLFAFAAPLVIVVLVAPLDCMTSGTAVCAARAEADDISSTHHLHNLAAVTLQLVLVATPFAVALAVRGSRWAPWAAGFGVLGVATVLAVGLSDPGEPGYGLLQRATFGFVNVWVSVIAMLAFRRPSRDRVGAP